jgi:hypothetical protein
LRSLVRTTLIGIFFFPRGSFETRSAIVLSSQIRLVASVN